MTYQELTPAEQGILASTIEDVCREGRGDDDIMAQLEFVIANENMVDETLPMSYTYKIAHAAFRAYFKK